MRFWTTLGLALLFASQADAQISGSTTSNQILSDCKLAMGPQPKIKSDEGWGVLLSKMRCEKFLLGAVQGYEMAIQAQAGHSRASLCMPVEVNLSQAVRVYVKWLEVHPEHLHNVPIVTLFASLIGAFPCK